MKKKNYTLHIRQMGQYQYEVTVPEIGATKMAATLDSALNITLHDILKHLTTRSLILVFVDQDADREARGVEPQACSPTVLEDQTAQEVVHLGIAPQVKRRERHLMFEVTRPLTRAQTTWLGAIRGYDGEVMCFLETGQDRATQLVFNYEHPPHPPRPSLYYHMEKQLFNRAYWHIVPQGLV